jgi:hypothetical protein
MFYSICINQELLLCVISFVDLLSRQNITNAVAVNFMTKFSTFTSLNCFHPCRKCACRALAFIKEVYKSVIRGTQYTAVMYS